MGIITGAVQPKTSPLKPFRQVNNMRTASLLLCLLLPLMALATAPDYPGCDLNVQHPLMAAPVGSMTDVREAHIVMRADVLQADIGNARKARQLTQPEARALWQDIAQVRKDSARWVKVQGFLSAAERASYDRALDRVAVQLCKRG